MSRVEFFTGAAKLGEDTTAPHSFVPLHVGTL
jgi:hypothetical protein